MKYDDCKTCKWYICRLFGLLDGECSSPRYLNIQEKTGEIQFPKCSGIRIFNTVCLGWENKEN